MHLQLCMYIPMAECRSVTLHSIRYVLLYVFALKHARPFTVSVRMETLLSVKYEPIRSSRKYSVNVIAFATIGFVVGPWRRTSKCQYNKFRRLWIQLVKDENIRITAKGSKHTIAMHHIGNYWDVIACRHCRINSKRVLNNINGNGWISFMICMCVPVCMSVSARLGFVYILVNFAWNKRIQYKDLLRC